MRIPEHDERAARDSGHLRLDQPQHRLRGDDGIDRVAAAFEHLEGGPGCQRMRGLRDDGGGRVGIDDRGGIARELRACR